MTPARRDILKTFGLALLLFPFCMATWYAASSVVGWLPARIAAPAVTGMAGKVVKVNEMDRMVGYTVEVEGPYRPGGSASAEARVDVPAANYTFGIAIFVALALAARGWRKPARFVAGIAILLVLPAVGIAFDALRQLGASSDLAPLLAWRPATREAIALGYQVGSLLLPTLGPIAIWLALFPDAWTTSRSGKP
jgi:hypothetical protein